MTPCSCGCLVAPGKWNDGKQQRSPITNHACLSHASRPTDRPTDRCHPRLITHSGCNCPTMNSPSRADRLGHVYSLVEISVTGIVVMQILIGYRCSVDKAADSMCVLFVHSLGINYCRVDLLLSTRVTASARQQAGLLGATPQSPETEPGPSVVPAD